MGDEQATSGDDGWETSTELPGAIGPQGSEVADGEENAGGEEGEEREQRAGGGDDEQVAENGEDAAERAGNSEDGEDAEGGSGGELARALEDLDGEILDERIAAARPDDPGRGGPAGGSAGGGVQRPGGQEGTGTSESGAGAMPGRRAIASRPPATPSPPLPARPDTPDAKDDDVVARQLREAAMAETDPELRERLWAEYERYKAGL